MIGSRVASVGRAGESLVLFLVVMLSFLLIIFAGQAVAQEPGPLAGETATITDTADADEVANTVTIAVADCTVDTDATIVVEDTDNTRVTLTNGDNVGITTSADGILITGTDDGNIEGGTGGDGVFRRGSGEVIRSTGITCGTPPPDDNVSGDQNDDDDGDIINVPDKPLPNTGGATPSSLVGVLAYGSVFLVIPMLCITLIFLAERFKESRRS